VDAFHANDIDEAMLPRLTDANLQAIGIASLGHRLKLLEAIAARSKQSSETNATTRQQHGPLSWQ
jgi:SAM domain (Sterile alpha motif)